MSRITAVLIALILVLSGVAYAQEEAARVRVAQQSFQQQSDGSYALAVDIILDGEQLEEQVAFPFTTDYHTVAAGTHTLSTGIEGDSGEATASVELELEAGHSYSVIVSGDYGEDDVQFIVIDDTALPIEETGSAAILVNWSERALDVYFGEVLIAVNVAPGGYALASVPIGEFTTVITSAGEPDAILLEMETRGERNTVYLSIGGSTSDGNLQVITHRSSDLNMADYLAALEPEDEFGPLAALVAQAEFEGELGSEGPFTLFAPRESVLNEMPADALPSDVTLLSAALGDHVVAENLPPYLLVNHETLTTLQGHTLTLVFAETESGFWEIEGAPIYSDIRVANGVIYSIGGVLQPSE